MVWHREEWQVPRSGAHEEPSSPLLLSESHRMVLGRSCACLGSDQHWRSPPFFFIPGPGHELFVWNRVGKHFLKGPFGKYPCRPPSLSRSSGSRHYNMEVAMGALQMNEHGWAPVRLYLHKQMVGWIWLMGRSLPTSGLEGKAGID